jgi:predicted extracellular nuclease
MIADDLTTQGAFALYRAENAHRVAEFAKTADADAAIAADFNDYRQRYLRKFQDFSDSLASLGLTITRSGTRAA